MNPLRLPLGHRGVSAENELSMLLEDYGSKMRQIERTMTLIEELAKQIPWYEKMIEIKGVCLMVAAGLLAEVGDISRFNHPKLIQKLSGLSLK